MSKINDLRSKLEPKQSRLEELNALVEGNAITDQEMTELRSLSTEIEGMVADIEVLERAKKLAADKAHAAFKSGANPEEKAQKRFNIIEAARELIDNGGVAPKDGFYGEIHQEAKREAVRRGVGELQGIGIPSFMQRGVDAATAATASNLIPTIQEPFTPALRPKTVLQVLGAKFLTDLVGEVELPAGDGLTSASFFAEAATASESTPTTKKPTLTPHRLAVWSKSTLQLMRQSSISVADWLENEILSAEARKVEEVAILGGGTNEPTGILGMSGTNLVAMGTNGGNITRAKLLEMEAALEVANAEDGMIKFLTTPGVKAFLKDLPTASGIGPMVWTDANTLIGYDALKSNLVPKTLTKGTASGVCHAIILGDWSKLLIGSWGLRDLTVDNISKKKAGEMEIILNSFWDVQVVHKAGFSVIKDVTV